MPGKGKSSSAQVSPPSKVLRIKEPPPHKKPVSTDGKLIPKRFWKVGLGFCLVQFCALVVIPIEITKARQSKADFFIDGNLNST